MVSKNQRTGGWLSCIAFLLYDSDILELSLSNCAYLAAERRFQR